MRPPRPGRSNWLPASLRGRTLLLLWLIALALWAQFTFASVEELELQAAALGGIVAVIMLVGGVVVWLAKLQTNRDL